MGRIVVGVDGSVPSEKALKWAAAEAATHGARLEVVYVYDDTPAYELYEYPGFELSEFELSDQEFAGERAENLVRSMVSRVVSDESLDVEPIAVKDRRPSRTLLRIAEGADQLVVGSRGRGGFEGLLLGSVSHQCAQYARCPLTIVPTDSV